MTVITAHADNVTFSWALQLICSSVETKVNKECEYFQVSKELAAQPGLCLAATRHVAWSTKYVDTLGC